MDLKQALPLIYEMAANINFVIDGKFLELKGEDIMSTIAQIDEYFSSWKSHEKNPADKI
jgi:hypothetical protein